MKVIGLMGFIGAGKDTVSDYLRDKYGYDVVIMGDVVREEFKKRGLPETREALQDLQKEMVQKHGIEYWAKKTVERIKEKKFEKVVINGIRRPVDASVPKKEFGDDMITIIVNADTKIRFERLKKRARPGDPKTIAEFKAQEKREWKMFDFKKTLTYADYTIKNNGTVDELQKQIDKLVEKVGFG